MDGLCPFFAFSKVPIGNGAGRNFLEMKMSIRKMTATDKLAETKINGKKAVVNWSVKADGEKTTPRYMLTSTFDFSGCSDAEILSLALKSVVIEAQRQWRDLANTKGSTATTVNPFATVNVKSAIVDATRRTADPVARATAMAKKLTPEQIAAIAREMGLAVTAPAKKNGSAKKTA